ncbi:glycoside hydrolase family 64 protein [Cellulosimicrobium arenosum]|uniref:Ricin-type beta-trefoil lectin domain protein n=1 Tax=Cellulosimicrobium arenosum TaxID=2708133 RepID=A0A927G8F2_9MICO|nr:beta-1,3-glucanase family protein [Cellulosimicrobium arenosum]MBD8078842.1 ricin-type beta-trefoil lectin domain protein [Cellulosimicrobium arenosum]
MRKLVRAWAAVCAAALVATGAVTVTATSAAAVPATIPLTITNDAGRGPVYVYVIGENLQNGDMGYADASGAFHPWPDAGPQPVPAPDASIPGPGAGQEKTIRLPKLSGRVYFSYGKKLSFSVVNDGRLVQPAVQNPTDPNRDTMFSWTEYTLNDAGLWINSTQVDFFSAPYQVGLKKADGSIISTGMLKSDGFDRFFSDLAATPGAWGNLVQRAPDGSILRALNPSHGLGVGLVPENVMDGYVDRVWDHYRTRDLVVRPFGYDQSVVFTGRVVGDRMRFTNDSGAEVASFVKPSADSIFGCHKDLLAPNDQIVGPIARTLCAGFNRTTLLTNATQPDQSSAGFYQDTVTNYYAKLVHAQMANGKAYAFAFDDVSAQESLVHDGNPTAAYISLDPFSGSANPVGDGGGEVQNPGDGGFVGTGEIQATNGMCLDVPWADPTDGNQIQIVGCSGNAAQRWTRASDGTVRALGKCLDVAGGSSAGGTKVQLWDCNGTGAQTWQYDAGTHELRNPQSGRCLDAAGGAPLHDGQKLIIWDCWKGPGQRWTV